MDLNERVRDIEIEMAQHDAQCEERWKTTFNRLEDIDSGITRINSKLMLLQEQRQQFESQH